jgi:hypothetical protein
MSWYPVAQEITSIYTDFVVERRGFEPMAIAVSRTRIAGFAVVKTNTYRT